MKQLDNAVTLSDAIVMFRLSWSNFLTETIQNCWRKTILKHFECGDSLTTTDDFEEVVDIEFLRNLA